MEEEGVVRRGGDKSCVSMCAVEQVLCDECV